MNFAHLVKAPPFMTSSEYSIIRDLKIMNTHHDTQKLNFFDDLLS